jgi:hypothetical protein
VVKRVGTERNVYADDELVNRHLAVAVAVADA